MSILLFEFQYSNFERVTENKLEKCVDICFKLGSTQNQNAAFRFSIYKNKKMFNIRPLSFTNQDILHEA